MSSLDEGEDEERFLLSLLFSPVGADNVGMTRMCT